MTISVILPNGDAYKESIPTLPTDVPSVRAGMEKLFKLRLNLIDIKASYKKKIEDHKAQLKETLSQESLSKTALREEIRHNPVVKELEVHFERTEELLKMVTDMIDWYRSLHSAYMKELN